MPYRSGFAACCALAWLAAPPFTATSARAQAPAARDTLRIVFVGDLNFARSLASTYLLAGRGVEVLAGVTDRLRQADIAVGNLESILLERGNYADTTNSPVFAGPQQQAIPLLLEAGFDVLGTANNHAWDFGREGLLQSLAHLDSAGLKHTGTGPDLEAAWRPVVVRSRGWTVAVFSMTGIFNYPDLTVRGHPAECCVAWLDTELAARRFRWARDSLGADLVIAFVHAGMEYRRVPGPDVVTNFRALARAGADAVIGHHPHVPQGVEWVGTTPIVYSLGNFVFRQRQAWTDRGLWAQLIVTEARGHGGTGTQAHPRTDAPAVRLQLLPLAVGYTPRFLSGADSARVMLHVDSLSALIPREPRLPNAGRRRNVARPSTRSRH